MPPCCWNMAVSFCDADYDGSTSALIRRPHSLESRMRLMATQAVAVGEQVGYVACEALV